MLPLCHRGPYIRGKGHKTKLVLDITDGITCVRVDIISVTQCPAVWELSQPVQPNLQVIGSLRPELKIDWKETKLVNKGVKVDLPYKVGLCFCQKAQLKKIIHSKTFYFLHHNMALMPQVAGNKSESNFYPSLHV